MGNGAGEGSDCCVSPAATQSKEFTVTLQSDGRTTSTIKRGAEATCWGLKHFQWYLTVLAILVLVAISLASSYIDGIGENTRSLLDELDVRASTVSRVITGVEWVIAATWALAGTTMLASVFAALNKFYIVWRREDFDRHAASGSINAERSWQACVGFNFSRALLNAVHVCVMLTACWFIVLLCAAVTCVTLFYFVDEATSRAIGDIVTAEENTNTFTESITEWMRKHSDDLAALAATADTLCAVSRCPPKLQESLATLDSLDEEVARVSASLAASEAATCPSTSCINLSQIWFLEADGCVCASKTVRAVRDHASDAAENSFWASIFVAIALFATLLMLSKTAMNLKSLLKNERWIKRMRRVFSKLASRGVRFTSDDSAFLPSSSSADRFQDLVYAALPSTTALPLPASTSSDSATVPAPPAQPRWRHAAAAALRRLPSRRRGAAATEPPPRNSAELVAVELADTAPGAAAATGEGRWDALQSIAGEETYADLAIETSLKQMLDRASSRRASSLTSSDKLHPPDHYIMLQPGPTSPRSTPSFCSAPAAGPSPLPTASTFTLDHSSNESSPDAGAGDGQTPESARTSLRAASDASATAAVTAPGGAPADWHARLAAVSAAVESSSSLTSPRLLALEPRNSFLDPDSSSSPFLPVGPAAVSSDTLAPIASADSAFAIAVQAPTVSAFAQHAAQHVDRPPIYPGGPVPLVSSTLHVHAAAVPAGPPVSRGSSGFVTAPSQRSGDRSDGSGSSADIAASRDDTSTDSDTSTEEGSSGLSIRQSGPLPLTPAIVYHDSSSGTIPPMLCDSLSPEIPFLVPPADDPQGGARAQHALFGAMEDEESSGWSD